MKHLNLINILLIAYLCIIIGCMIHAFNNLTGTALIIFEFLLFCGGSLTVLKLNDRIKK